MPRRMNQLKISGYQFHICKARQPPATALVLVLLAHLSRSQLPTLPSSPSTTHCRPSSTPTPQWNRPHPKRPPRYRPCLGNHARVSTSSAPTRFSVSHPLPFCCNAICLPPPVCRDWQLAPAAPPRPPSPSPRLSRSGHSLSSSTCTRPAGPQSDTPSLTPPTSIPPPECHAYRRPCPSLHTQSIFSEPALPCAQL